MTIVEENHSLSQMQSGMPYLYSLAQRFAYATNYEAITHPSLPNYLSIADGSSYGIADDNPPSSHPISGNSVFDQAIMAGKTAKTYAESMTSNCEQSSSGTYAVKHNPWAYQTDAAQHSNCLKYDVPSGTPTSGQLHDDIVSGTLPNAGLVIPNLCNDAHDCSLATADAWLRSWLPQIMGGPDYRSGSLAIVITADEDGDNQGNLVLTTVIAPQLDGSHKIVTTPLNHYSLTLLYDQILGVPPLHNAATAASMKVAFGL
jgi:phosphatidylinositol-3-phosphatase